MKPSVIQTLSVPVIGSRNPSRLIQAGKEPMRVLVRNVGGNVVYLAHDVPDLNQVNNTGAVYQLPPGQSDVFVLAPGQSLIAAANGAGGSISIAASEAIPIGKTWMES